jgi:hypothetical protein
MAELVALRAILLNVLFKLANGEKPGGGGDATFDRPGRLGQSAGTAGTSPSGQDK